MRSGSAPGEVKELPTQSFPNIQLSLGSDAATSSSLLLGAFHIQVLGHQGPGESMASLQRTHPSQSSLRQFVCMSSGLRPQFEFLHPRYCHLGWS